MGGGGCGSGRRVVVAVVAPLLLLGSSGGAGVSVRRLDGAAVGGGVSGAGDVSPVRYMFP